MVALVVGDRAQETCTTTGTGTLSLLGAVTQFQSFAAVGVSTGNTISYSTQFTVADQSGANWETSIGVYTTSGSTLTRTTVLSSSNAGALVNFGAGTKSVFINYSATMSVSGGGGGTYPTIQPSLNLDFANTRQLDPRITFVRNSTAAYYDGQTSALAEQNLLTYSQDFSNGVWSKNVTTTTANTTTAPDGTSTASTFLVNNTSTGGSMFQGSGPTWVAGATVLFDLSTGTVGTVTSGSFTATAITSVGNSWYRCSVVKDGYTISFYAKSNGWTAVAVQCYGSEKMRLYPSTTSTAITGTGDGTNGVYLWGAQLEQRSSVTAYTPTTTAVITNYIPVLMTAPAGVARFDCDPITGKSLGLLIEESRTNLLLYSATFSNAAWTLTNATLTAAATIAPDGTQTAFNLVSNTSTGLQAIAQTVTKAASALAYTSTIHFKANQYTYSWLQISDGAGNGAIVYFNLTTGAISTAIAGVGTAFTALSATTPTSIGNGWYRCNITGTSNTATSLVTQFGSSTNGTSNSVVGNGYSGVFIWGAQAE